LPGSGLRGRRQLDELAERLLDHVERIGEFPEFNKPPVAGASRALSTG
jgi:hypothetical protein